jgi:hypothetical protein
MTLLYPVIAALSLLFPKVACILWGALLVITWWQRAHY